MKKIFIITVLTYFTFGCEELLEEPVYSQLAPENVFKTEEGVESILFAGYSELYNTTGNNRGIKGIEEWGTDIGWQTGGGENSTAVQFMNFTHGSTTGIFEGVFWNPNFRGIRNVNVVLDNIEESGVAENKKALFTAEARFIRAMCYSKMYFLFGPVPIRQSENDPLEMARPTEEEMETFIEEELLEAIQDLPNPGEELNYGRANKGTAWAGLTKFYLNTHQWQKSADAAQVVMDFNYYELYPDYFELFHVENERNKEFIYVKPVNIYATRSNSWVCATFPPGFQTHPRTGLTWQDNWRTIASQYRIQDIFYNSFEPGDKRKDLIMEEYVNTEGDTVSLLNQDNTRSFKYWPDPNALSNIHGNDLPQIRYADILLSRAEALNELNGPNQESIDLINLVRDRADVDDILLTSFASKEDLRDHILKERGWEFYSESMRRYDMIRMGKFISFAQSQGKDARDYHVRLPIPQAAMDSNPKLVQNDGY
tara:strand:- start:120458 stop:121906 length:1449 start_codon:yes stop_codon:yes gene_type:complete